MNIVESFRRLWHRHIIVRKIKNGGGNVGKGVKFSVAGELRVGKDVILNSAGIGLLRMSRISVSKGAVLEIGDHSGLSQFVVNCKNHIVIGQYVNIGAGTMIIDSNFHSTDWEVRRNRLLDKNSQMTAPIYIGDDVFIGTRCLITKGVTIGARSMIAAGSVVVKDIPADCIAGGNPCKVIKYLK